MNISEIRSKADKETIIELSGRVTKVEKRKTGDSTYGPYSVQSMTLKDQTGEISVQVWNKDELASLMNRAVTIGSVQGEKGWAGCAVEDHVYNNKTYRRVKLTGAGRLEEYKPKAPELAQPTDERPPQQFPTISNGKIPWWDYAEMMTRAHDKAKDLEPNDPQARAALVNTAMIAFTNGKIGMPEKEEDIAEEGAPPHPAESDDDIPF